MIGQRVRGGGGGGGRLSKCSKTIYYKSVLGAISVQTCRLKSITMACIQYVVLIHLSEQVRLNELET